MKKIIKLIFVFFFFKIKKFLINKRKKKFYNNYWNHLKISINTEVEVRNLTKINIFLEVLKHDKYFWKKIC